MSGYFTAIDPHQYKHYWLDVPYGNDPRQSMDIWLPDEGDGPFPLIVFTHGGGWVGGAIAGVTNAIMLGVAVPRQCRINYWRLHSFYRLWWYVLYSHRPDAY